MAVWDILSNMGIMQYVYFIGFIVILLAAIGYWIWHGQKEQG